MTVKVNPRLRPEPERDSSAVGRRLTGRPDLKGRRGSERPTSVPFDLIGGVIIVKRFNRTAAVAVAAAASAKVRDNGPN